VLIHRAIIHRVNTCLKIADEPFDFNYFIHFIISQRDVVHYQISHDGNTI